MVPNINHHRKPKPALSCYNIFFQIERKRILAGIDENKHHPIIREEMLAVIKEWKSKPNKRRHRRSHGKIGFEELSRKVASKWKVLDSESLHVIRTQAQIEKERHQYDMRRWKASIKAQSHADRPKSCFDTIENSLNNVTEVSSDESIPEVTCQHSQESLSSRYVETHGVNPPRKDVEYCPCANEQGCLTVNVDNREVICPASLRQNSKNVRTAPQVGIISSISLNPTGECQQSSTLFQDGYLWSSSDPLLGSFRVEQVPRCIFQMKNEMEKAAQELVEPMDPEEMEMLFD